ncbi:DUF1653 domain-containing protein [Dyella acidisoli]|uniref:DUF1653 domain-containing protein n=1 Tax=Dyella acidisoli TaxID=1867834 RepID=A0ABQ5XLB4_9GAMM|nr:DUF1653 domain-containing protein [Dyella acidisoli]GLQ92157.1 hypothetical protein GCM10007901_11080 [Dyella acidisoli]
MSIATGIYRHYKGQSYRVIGTARHSETMEELVVYQALYGDHGLWVRPATMFAETVELEGEPIPRFALIEAMPAEFAQASHRNTP